MAIVIRLESRTRHQRQLSVIADARDATQTRAICLGLQPGPIAGTYWVIAFAKLRHVNEGGASSRAYAIVEDPAFNPERAYPAVRALAFLEALTRRWPVRCPLFVFDELVTRRADITLRAQTDRLLAARKTLITPCSIGDWHRYWIGVAPAPGTGFLESALSKELQFGRQAAAATAVSAVLFATGCATAGRANAPMQMSDVRITKLAAFTPVRTPIAFHLHQPVANDSLARVKQIASPDYAGSATPVQYTAAPPMTVVAADFAVVPKVFPTADPPVRAAIFDSPLAVATPLTLPSPATPVAVSSAPRAAVFFDTAASALSRAELATLSAVLDAARASERIVLTGRTDATGSRVANERLAFARAYRVKVALVRLGVAPSRIEVRADIVSQTPIAREARVAQLPQLGTAQQRRVDVSF